MTPVGTSKTAWRDDEDGVDEHDLEDVQATDLHHEDRVGRPDERRRQVKSRLDEM